MSNGGRSSGIIHMQEQSARKRSLAAALVEVRNRQAIRDDVVVDMKEAEQARLELLAEEVRPLFEDLPPDNDQFEFALSNGKPLRLWIDMTSHVTMGHDKRTYRFLKDTNAGRIVLAENHDMQMVADEVGKYVAERVLEKQRILEGEWTGILLNEETEIKARRTQRSIALQSFFWFVAGFALSAAAIYLWSIS